jgi:hypothetical protein
LPVAGLADGGPPATDHGWWPGGGNDGSAVFAMSDQLSAALARTEPVSLQLIAEAWHADVASDDDGLDPTPPTRSSPALQRSSATPSGPESASTPGKVSTRQCGPNEARSHHIDGPYVHAGHRYARPAA